MTSQQLLSVRLSIVMIRENYNFLNTLNDFQLQLKKHFNYEYTQDEIENALHKMEEDFLAKQFIEEQNRDLPEIPEDYFNGY
jgi:hypothetical protein